MCIYRCEVSVFIRGVLPVVPAASKDQLRLVNTLVQPARLIMHSFGQMAKLTQGLDDEEDSDNFVCSVDCFLRRDPRSGCPCFCPFGSEHTEQRGERTVEW